MKIYKPVDVSHVVEHGMVTYKGLPAPIICDYLSREASQAYLPDNDFRFFAVPVKVKGFGTFPVRAFGLIAT